MGKITIYCVRHAEGYHNLNTANHQIPDPSLTATGEQQCATLASIFPHHSKITQLIASPLRRTIYTALLSFPEAVASGKTILALAELQETSDLPCDTGSATSVLAEEFSQEQVDFNLVKEGWNNKRGVWSPASSAIEARARAARRYIRKLALQSSEEDQHIVIVTHGGYLHYFTEDWHGAESGVGTGWTNTEYRTYEFVSETDDSASLRETRASRERRRGSETVLSKDEQRELRASAEREWMEHGFQREDAKL
jgi:broad specificity phosphatase PhoE